MENWPKFDRAAYEKRVQWYTEARFGMFIHWGLYAIPARGEWVRNNEEIPAEDYEPLKYEFQPDSYEPKEWARLAKKAGMEYAVLTAKHHDGYCLFDTKNTDFNSMVHTGRDFVREFLEAFRAEGIRVGLYYSVIDWRHPDFPHYGDKIHPMRNKPEYSNENRDFDRYLVYMNQQIEELCTNYGKLDIVWFDYSYDNMTGETWHATELVHKLRQWQPDIIMNNRLEVSGEGFGSLLTKNPSPYSGDFVSPEQIIPPRGIFDEEGRRVVWEACVTMNNNWGYCSTDKNFKPADMLIKKLVECVSKGGNMILNVGPDATGRIPDESVKILEDIGKWMSRNKASIKGCGCADMEKPEYGRITRSNDGKTLYYHVTEPQIGYVYLPGITQEQVANIRLLYDGSERKIDKGWITSNYADLVFVKLSDSPLLPDPIDTVIKVTLK